MSTPWAVATFVSACLAILAEPLEEPWLLWIFKPLTTLLIIAYAARGAGSTAAAKRWLITGLLCSLAGDVALMWPQRGFLPGLVSFLFAHLCYLGAFTRDRPWRPGALMLLPYGVLSAPLLAVLWPGVPVELRAPVLVYVAALAAMAAAAGGRGWQLRGARGAGLASLGALGGLLFVGSDGLLAFDRFHTPLPWASAGVLSSYWLAQWCIATSLRHRSSG